MNMTEYNDHMWDYTTLLLENRIRADRKRIQKMGLPYISRQVSYRLKDEHKHLKGLPGYHVDSDNLRSFMWEVNNTYLKPNRTMKWIHGEHVMLYDWHLCTECGTLVKTTDDREECLYVPALCPDCNNIKNYPYRTMSSSTTGKRELKFYRYLYESFEATSRFHYSEKGLGRLGGWVKKLWMNIRLDLHVNLIYREALKKK